MFDAKAMAYGNRSLVSTVTSFLTVDLCGSLLSSPRNTTNNVGHRTRPRVAEDLDSDEVGRLCDTVLPRSDGTGTVGAVPVTVKVVGAGSHGLAPLGAPLKLDVVDVDAGIDDVDVDSFAIVVLVLVLAAENGRRRCMTCQCARTPVIRDSR